MRTTRTNAGGPRRAGRAAVIGTTALAIIGASMLSATAANADTVSCTTTTGSTMLLDTTGTGGALINLGSTGGVLGVTTSNGLSANLLNCTVVATVGGSGVAPTVTLLPTTLPTAQVTTLPTTPSTSTTPATGTTSPATDTTSPATATTTTAAPTTLATVEVTSSATTVYPAKDGYKDKVVFSIKGLTAASTGVTITGKAVLKKGTKVVKTWTITSSTTKLSWNGKIGTKIKAGLYKLTVTAWSADGTRKVSTMSVHVSAKHLITKTVSVKSKNIASASTAKLPATVAKAYRLGTVTVRIRTVADVHGTAKLVFTHGTTTRSVALRDGTHTTKAIAVPKGFGTVKIGHKWAKGAATLTSLKALFSYKKLV